MALYVTRPRRDEVRMRYESAEACRVILWLFTEDESRFLIKFLINANQIKLKYNLLTSSFI